MNPIYIYSLDFWFNTQNFGQYENDYIINFDILLLFGINYHTYIKVYYNKLTEDYNA